MKSLNIISILMSIQLCGAMVLANNIWEDDMEASGHEASTMDSEVFNSITNANTCG